MKSQDVIKLIKELYPLKRSICIESSPGTGKTSVVKQAANELGVPLILIHAPTMLIEDTGIPWPKENEDYFSYKLPYWFPKEEQPEGILLFDDRNQVSEDIQKVLANLIQERTLHGFSLPKGWMVISTGNRVKDKTGSRKVLSHLRNRETVIEFEPSLQGWTEWAVANGVSETTVGFINYRPDLLNKYDPDKDINPTPRAWVEGVDNLLGSVSREHWRNVILGSVGEGAADEYMGWIQIAETMVDLNVLIKDIEQDPKTAYLPSDSMTSYAIISGLAYRANKDNLGKLITYTQRISMEFVVLLMMIARNADPNIIKNRDYIDFLITNQNLVL